MALSLYEPDRWPELMSPAQLSKLVNITPGTVGRWCEEGTIEAVKIGRVWRIPREVAVGRLTVDSRALAGGAVEGAPGGPVIADRTPHHERPDRSNALTAPAADWPCVACADHRGLRADRFSMPPARAFADA